MLFQRIQQRRSKAEIARLEFGRVFRAVDTGKVEDEVRLGAEFVQLFRSAVNVVFVNFINLYIRACTVLEVTDIFQIFCEIRPTKPFAPVISILMCIFFFPIIPRSRYLMRK